MLCLAPNTDIEQVLNSAYLELQTRKCLLRGHKRALRFGSSCGHMPEQCEICAQAYAQASDYAKLLNRQDRDVRTWMFYTRCAFGVPPSISTGSLVDGIMVFLMDMCSYLEPALAVRVSGSHMTFAGWLQHEHSRVARCDRARVEKMERCVTCLD